MLGIVSTVDCDIGLKRPDAASTPQGFWSTHRAVRPLEHCDSKRRTLVGWLFGLPGSLQSDAERFTVLFSLYFHFSSFLSLVIINLLIRCLEMTPECAATIWCRLWMLSLPLVVLLCVVTAHCKQPRIKQFQPEFITELPLYSKIILTAVVLPKGKREQR